jgi:uncharacterized membrane protein HdeD (DUF308 family)
MKANIWSRALHAASDGGLRSRPMSEGLARNWWAVRLRVIAAIALIIVLALPRPTTASLIIAFGVYVAADGIFAIISGIRAIRRGERWKMLILEGSINLAMAGAMLAIPELAIIPLVHLTSAWAVLTGALALAASRRLADGYGRWLLAFSGGMSIAWGALQAAAGPSAESDASKLANWLLAYAILFGLTMLALSLTLRRSATTTTNSARRDF